MVEFMYKGQIIPKVIHIYYFLLLIKKEVVVSVFRTKILPLAFKKQFLLFFILYNCRYFYISIQYNWAELQYFSLIYYFRFLFSCTSLVSNYTSIILKMIVLSFIKLTFRLSVLSFRTIFLEFMEHSVQNIIFETGFFGIEILMHVFLST